MSTPIDLRRYLVIILTAAGLTLLALAKWLDGNDRPRSGPQRRRRPLAQLVDLPKSDYRYRRPEPSRWEVYRAGFAVLFNSVAFATVGA